MAPKLRINSSVEALRQIHLFVFFYLKILTMKNWSKRFSFVLVLVLLYSVSFPVKATLQSNAASVPSNNVLLLQQYLKQKGYLPAETQPTGNFDLATIQAFMNWQKSNNVSATELWETLNNLNSPTVPSQPAPQPAPTAPVITGNAKAALPLYIYPSANEKNWEAAISAGNQVDFIIANVNNGPDAEKKTVWTNMINKAVAKGIKVYGYVKTDYTGVSGATADKEVSRWLSFYPQISGIFFDKVSSGADKLPYYEARYSYVKKINPNLTVVINPGTNTVEGYMNVSDVNMIFTNSYSNWLKNTVPAWVAKYPKERFYTMVHGVPNETEMKKVVQTAKAKNFGKMFITSASGASDPLPSYFRAELAEITGTQVSPTPAPTAPSPSAPVVTTKAKTALPLYVYPYANEKNWEMALSAASGVDFIIANVYDGPDTEVKTNWTNMINKAVAKGIKVYGYVSTDYTRVNGGTVDRDVSLWLKFYPQISGFFFDETTNGADKLPYYKARYDYVKKINPNLQVVINPGTNTDEGYMTASDVNVIFEASYNTWLTKTSPAWVSKYPKERFYAIIYDVLKESDMIEAVRTAKARNFGKIFITSADGPSDPLPSYFQAQLAEIAR